MMADELLANGVDAGGLDDETEASWTASASISWADSSTPVARLHTSLALPSPPTLA